MSLVLTGALVAGCSATDPNSSPGTGDGQADPDAVVNVALGSDIDLLDPHMFRTDAAYVVTANVYAPLLRQQFEEVDGALQGTDEYEGGLAETWEISEDGREAVFNLRTDAEFADGTPVTSADVKYTFERAMLGPGYITALLPFVGIDKPEQIETPDDHTVVLRPSFKSPLFERFMTFQVFGAINSAEAEKHATEDDPWATEWMKDNVTPSDAYQVAEVARGRETVLEPNPNYWGADEVKNGGVRLRVVPDPDQRVLLLRSGDVDLVDSIPPRLVPQLEEDPALNVFRLPSSRITYLGMNNKIAPFDDERVRQAISYAIPYQDIIDKVQYGYASLAKGPVPPAMSSSAGEELWPYETNVEKAKELLAEAGATNLSTEFVVRQAIPQDAEAAVFIQDALREIGIDVTIERVPDAVYFQRLNEHSLPMFLHDWFSWGEDPFFQMSFLLKSGAFTNYADYSNPEFDALLEEGTFELDPEKRAEISRQAQEIAIEEAPWAFLYSADYIVAARQGVTGVTRPFDQTLRFEHLSKSE
ncbi:ABC transporter substrate-binding protein [Nocardioides sp.]|uniref:ABC transporter substrate-binding protein n=1 Tax=Nocardioides sp. TaxID=35761 RepID=UPI002633F18D|nr:ABC transporter substrate-binding protein [Nocardioides sp.]MDI6908203.1 ABC transporter substrate-binding protein [Nocardioides sp.]